MTMVKVKVCGYIMVPSYENDDILAQEDAADQVEAMLDGLALENAEVENTEIIYSSEDTHHNEDALYEERWEQELGVAA